MSSSAQQPSLPPKDDREKRGIGFGKVFSRVKIALRRGDSSSAKAKPPAATAPLQPPPSKAQPDTKSKPPAPVSKAAEARARYEGMEGVTKVAKTELFEERAKKLAERYGLEINAEDWIRTTPNDTVLRIDKPIRIRVRRTCHRCNTALFQAKECPTCQHPRCTKCPRYPPKRTEAEKVASREKRAALIQANKENPPIITDYSYNDRGIVLKRPSKTGGQDLYQKKPRQRVRRTCHECQTLFTASSKKCQDCTHIRCTDCPRDPPKKDKYPFGYPGDAFGPSSVPRYECQRCEALYPVGAEHGIACKKCGRERLKVA
ncbi:hypothetical protein G6O67_000387 [Ophiocordyceps sinensis]|uniref:Uncharacterized protein n=1 Tax=Ophiocordyceps sinensis TaxID=72228 RepID=A0A8H4V9X2_9HYPO|nr:hypothetical protein G6O67_000387 [Ophiocordyceps sinensis]